MTNQQRGRAGRPRQVAVASGIAVAVGLAVVAANTERGRRWLGAARNGTMAAARRTAGRVAGAVSGVYHREGQWPPAGPGLEDTADDLVRPATVLDKAGAAQPVGDNSKGHFAAGVAAAASAANKKPA